MKSIVIPARLASTRLPRKLLLDVLGKPLIWHTVQRALESTLAEQVVVATEDDEIAVAVDQFREKRVTVIKTPPMESGTTRIAWLAHQRKIGSQIVNLQGDEPLMPSRVIDDLFSLLDLQQEVVTVSTKITEDEFHDPNVVKVVADKTGRAMYFSRSPIPYNGLHLAKKHLGIYGYQSIFFQRLEHCTDYPVFISRTERLEQLGWMENGFMVKVLHQDNIDTIGIDSDDDYQSLLARLSQTVVDTGIA